MKKTFRHYMELVLYRRRKEEALKSFEDATDTHHQQMIESLNNHIPHGMNIEITKGVEVKDESTDINSEELYEYLKESLEYPLTPEVYEIFDEAMEKIWNEMEVEDWITTEILEFKLSYACVVAKTLVPEEVVGEIVDLVIHWLKENDFIS